MSLVAYKAFGSGLLALTFGGALWAGEFITNGSFSTSTYTVNTEFDTTFNPNNTKGSVSNWTGTGYAIYFFAGTQSTNSAVGQFSTGGTSGVEKLYATANKLSPDGGNFVALDADPNIGSTISQTLTGLTVNTHYQVSFYWAASQLQSRSGATNEAVGVQVFDASNVLALNYTSASVQNPSGGFTIDTATNNWFKVTLNFAATSSTETIKFLSKSTSTCLPPMVLLDGISVTNVAVPEPTTVTLMGAGIALVGVAAVRRRRPGKKS